MTTFSKQEMLELRRMLASFRAELPPHELGYWFVTSRPVETVIEDDPPPRTGRMSSMHEGYVSVRGHAHCVRCLTRFEIPSIGNFTTHPDRIDRTIANAKEWVAREAEQAGPCWGDVPKVKEDGDEFAAVLDSVTTTREP